MLVFCLFFAEAKVAEDELEGYEQFVLSLLSGSDAWPWTMILNGGNKSIWEVRKWRLLLGSMDHIGWNEVELCCF